MYNKDKLLANGDQWESLIAANLEGMRAIASRPQSG